MQLGGLNFFTHSIFSSSASHAQSAGPKYYWPLGIASKDLPRINAELVFQDHDDYLDTLV
jgi:N-acyl-phosphatidylethanolamine-hydrolysing phospholipase D